MRRSAWHRETVVQQIAAAEVYALAILMRVRYAGGVIEIALFKPWPAGVGHTCDGVVRAPQCDRVRDGYLRRYMF